MHGKRGRKKQERKSREKRKQARKWQGKNNRENKERKRKKERENTKKCDKACTNRLFPSLPLNSLLPSKLEDSGSSYLGPVLQSKQFLWQDFHARLLTLKASSILGLNPPMN